MRIYFVRLLFLTIMLALALPAEIARAQEDTKALTNPKKKKGKKKRRDNHRGKKRKAAKKKNGNLEPAAIDPSPFEEGDEESQGGEQDTDRPASDLEPEAGGGSVEDTDADLGQRETGSKLNLNEDGAVEEADGSLRRSGRMEFDERLVKGQGAKSGAVYLFKRMPRMLPGLIPLRRSYRPRIVEPVLGKRPLKPVIFSGKDTTGKKKMNQPPGNEEEVDEQLIPEAEKAEKKAEKKE